MILPALTRRAGAHGVPEHWASAGGGRV